MNVSAAVKDTAAASAILRDASAAVLLRHERSMAWPAFSADGLERSGVLVEAPRVWPAISIDSDETSEIDNVESVIALEQSMIAPVITETSVPIEIWEGVVDEVYDDAVAVTLRAKMNTAIPAHTMEIDIAEIQPQDRDLVLPGAVFYLTMYHETTGRTVKNVQDIRFRREPNWTRRMVAKMDRLAEELAF